jgi:alanyl-tRNA synthetase
MTERLYYTDSYLTEFTARVASVDGTRVYLDRTALYPTSGGQPHDLGTLGGAQVVDVVDEDMRIAHVLASAPTYASGEQVQGLVDWRRRFDYMQQHTGQHLLSAIFEDVAGCKTVSVHFGEGASTLDLDTDTLSADRCDEVARRANAAVLENRPVAVTFEDAATAAGLRKAADRVGDLRIVSIDTLDRSACGGTHVRSTGEIGPVVIRRVEKFKKIRRVEFLCGWRALDRARTDLQVLTRMATAMSAAIDDLPALVDSQLTSLRAADSDRRKLAEELAKHRARELHDAAAPDGTGLRRIADRTSAMDELRALAQAMSRLPRTLFVGATASPPSIVFATSEDTGIVAGTVLKAALAAHGGRGGGSPRVAQGTVDDVSALDAVVSTLMGAAQAA